MDQIKLTKFQSWRLCLNLHCQLRHLNTYRRPWSVNLLHKNSWFWKQCLPPPSASCLLYSGFLSLSFGSQTHYWKISHSVPVLPPAKGDHPSHKIEKKKNLGNWHLCCLKKLEEIKRISFRFRENFVNIWELLDWNEKTGINWLSDSWEKRGREKQNKSFFKFTLVSVNQISRCELLV